MGSSRTDPIAVQDHNGKPAQLWMRGRNNFDAVIDDLLTTQGMDKATEVILSGGSAGGLAVFYNLDHLVTQLSPSVRVTGFPDAGCKKPDCLPLSISGVRLFHCHFRSPGRFERMPPDGRLSISLYLSPSPP